MAHNLARHQGERMSSSVFFSILGILSLLIDPSGGLLYLFTPAVQLVGQLPNSRTQESEADQIGMRLAAEACYDPEALSRLFRRMETAGASKPPEFLSTHPSEQSRIREMQKWLPEEKKLFHMHDGERCRAFRQKLIYTTSTNMPQQFHGSDGKPCWK